MTLVVYYLYIEKDYEKLFMVLQKTKDIEYLAIKLLAYLEINRIDLANKVHADMKVLEEDHILT